VRLQPERPIGFPRTAKAATHEIRRRNDAGGDGLTIGSAQERET
jgi:hypothetical protein